MKKSTLFIWAVLFMNVSGMAQIQVVTINDTIVGVGSRTYDLNNDTQSDFQFEIIELSPGVLAQRVVPLNFSAVLDNSTFGYPDALVAGNPVASNFTVNTCVLGTFVSSGQFNGQGDRYLGVRIYSGIDFHYGWILINCRFNRDTIIIRSAGYNMVPFEAISAGQTVLTPSSVNDVTENLVFLNGNCVQSELRFNNTSISGQAEIVDLSGRRCVVSVVNGVADVSVLSTGLYIVRIAYQEKVYCGKFVRTGS